MIQAAGFRQVAAAGVHGWYLTEPDPARQRLLAGPLILHYRYDSVDRFRCKYLDIAASPVAGAMRLFVPSPAEAQILAELERLRVSGANPADLEQGLDELHAALTSFTEDEVSLLAAAG